MRYNLESTLPINAFSPRGGRGPFSRGMTLEGGGGGGGFFGGVTKAIGSVAKGITQAVKGVVQPVYNATLKNIPGVDNALVNLDKSVGKAIPGGWGTVASVAASFIPGAQFGAQGLLSGITRTQLATGLGALTGSGVMKKDHQFNLQGAIAGGALAYGAASLASGLEGAAEGASKTGAAAVEETGKSSLTQGLQSGSGSALTGTGSGYVPSKFLSGTSIGAGASQGASAFTPTANALANMGDDFIAPAITSGGTATGIGSLGTAAAPTNFGLSAALPEAGTSSLGGFGLGNISTQPGLLESAGNYLSNIPSNIADKASGAFDALTTPSNYTDFADSYAANVSKIGSGIKDLVTGAPGASAGFSASGASLTNTALPILAGVTGLDALQAQRDYLEQQNQAGAISDADYQSQVAEIDRQEAIARQSVAGSPFSTEPDRTYETQPTLYGIPTTSGATLYTKNPASSSATLYAAGGAVDNEMGFDDSPRGLGLGNMSNGFMNMGSTPAFAKGGQAHFLSGGGDGMSDDIPATIEGQQEARLADGEFIISSDVVSGLGNGSSKAGAKQLYSMMDRVRQARTGTKQQGKEINASKMLPA